MSMNKTKQKKNTSSFFGKVHEYLQSDFFDEEEKPHTSRKAKSKTGFRKRPLLYTLLIVLFTLTVIGSLITDEHRYEKQASIEFCERQKINVERMQQLVVEVTYGHILSGDYQFIERGGVLTVPEHPLRQEVFQTFETTRNIYYDHNCNLYFGNPEGVHDPR